MPGPIVFLDIDDVLCLSLPVGGYDVIDAMSGARPDVADVLERAFHPRCADALQEAHEALCAAGRQPTYIISSSWRRIFDRDTMARVFNGSRVPFVSECLAPGDAWCTPVLSDSDVRATEISLWMQANGHLMDSFIILDDQYSGGSLVSIAEDDYHPWWGRVLICKEHVGLQGKHAGAIVATLKALYVAPTKSA